MLGFHVLLIPVFLDLVLDDEVGQDTCDDGSDEWGDVVDPLELLTEGVSDEGWSEDSHWVDGGSGEPSAGEDDGHDGDEDPGSELAVKVLAGSPAPVGVLEDDVDGEDEEEGGHELQEEGLPFSDSALDHWVAEDPVVGLDVADPLVLEEDSGEDGPNQLASDVENGGEDVLSVCEGQGETEGWVQLRPGVSSTNIDHTCQNSSMSPSDID